MGEDAFLKIRFQHVESSMCSSSFTFETGY